MVQGGSSAASIILRMNEVEKERFHFADFAGVSLVVIALVLAALVVLSQANPLTTELRRDSGIYAYVSSQLLHGRTPYIAAWESKPPGIFFIDALALWLGKGTRWGIWAVEVCSLLGAALTGLRLLSRKFGWGAALFSTLLWMCGMGLTLDGGNLTEEYSLLFAFVCLLIFGSEGLGNLWGAFGFGLAFAAGFLIRPNNTGVQISIIATVLILGILTKQFWSAIKRLAVAGIGFVLPIAAVSIFFLSRNAFESFLEASLFYNLSYTGTHANFFSSLSSGAGYLGFTFGVALVGVIIALDTLRVQVGKQHISPIILWLCIDFLIEVALSGLSGRNYSHYFISWLPWMAVACAVLLSKVPMPYWKWVERHMRAVTAGCIAVIVVAYFGVFREYVATFQYLGAGQRPVQYEAKLETFVSEHTEPNETVLAWGGQAGINYLSKRDAPTAYTFYPLFVPSSFTDRASQQFYEDLSQRPPALILDLSGADPSKGLVPLSVADPVKWSEERGLYAPPYLAQFVSFVQANYIAKDNINSVVIYRLKK